MLIGVPLAHIDDLCGQRNFGRRRHQSLSTFFCPIPCIVFVIDAVGGVVIQILISPRVDKILVDEHVGLKLLY
jgi:hypothetical protein